MVFNGGIDSMEVRLRSPGPYLQVLRKGGTSVKVVGASGGMETLGRIVESW